jgi:hypothetical protein
MALPTPDIRQYLTDAYNDEEFIVLCSDYFRDVYESFTTGMTMGQKIQLLLDHCQRHDLLPALEAALQRNRPEQFRARFGPSVVEFRPAQAGPPPAPADTQIVRKGFSAMGELAAQNPKARERIAIACAGCEAVCAQLEVVRDYKALHDLLHELQFRCYGALEQEASRFPADAAAVDNAMDHSLTLQRIIGDLKKLAERRSLDTGGSSWIQSMVTAQDTLATAIERQDAGALNKTLFLLHRVLAVQPSRINASLKQAARDTRLDVAVQSLSEASEQLESLQLDPDKLCQFREGLQALDVMSQSISVCVLDHDRWQNLDVELRRVEDALKQGVTELEMSWPDLKVMGLGLFAEGDAEWAANLRKFGDALDQALATKDLPQIKRQFRYYRRQAAERFFQVDTDLKERCGELAQIGRSLAEQMRLLQ